MSGLMGENRKLTNIFDSAPTASSNLILEVTQGTDQMIYISASYNDQPFKLGGCTDLLCQVDQFKAYLSKVANLDVPKTCAAPKGTLHLYQAEI